MTFSQNCELGCKYAFKHKEKAGGEPIKRKSSVDVAKTIDHSHAEEKPTSLKYMPKGDLLRGVSAIPVNDCALARIDLVHGQQRRSPLHVSTTCTSSLLC